MPFTPTTPRTVILILLGTLLLHLTIYSLQPGRSGMYGVIFAATLLFSLTAAGITLWWTPQRRAKYRDAIARFRGAYLLFAGAVTIVLGLGLRPEWFYAHLVIVVALVSLLLHEWIFAGTAEAPRTLLRWRTAVLLIVGLAVALLVVRFWGLSISPPVNTVDEGWVVGWSYSFLRSGQLSDWIMLGEPVGYFGVPLYFAAQAGWLSLFGVGLVQARAFSFVLALLAILLASLAARNWYGTLAGVFTGLTLLGSSVFLYSFTARHDIGLALAMALSLWLYTEGMKRGQWRWHLGAGVAMGAGIAAHYHAALFGPALLVGLYLPTYLSGLRQGRWRPGVDMVAYGVGAATIGLSILLVQSSGTQTVAMADDLSSVDPTYFSNLRGFLELLPNLSYLEALLVLAGVVTAVLRRTSADISLVIMLTLCYLGLGLQVFISPSYLSPVAVVYAMLVGALATARNSQQGKLPVVTWKHASLFLMLTALAASVSIPALRHIGGGGRLHPTPPAVVTWIREHLPQSSIIVGEHTYFLYLYEYRFGSPLIAQWSVESGRDESREATWARLLPDAFILTPNVYFKLEIMRLVEADFFAANGYRAITFDDDVTLYVRDALDEAS